MCVIFETQSLYWNNASVALMRFTYLIKAGFVRGFIELQTAMNHVCKIKPFTFTTGFDQQDNDGLFRPGAAMYGQKIED